MVRKFITVIALLLSINFSYTQIDDNDTLRHHKCDNIRPFSHPEKEFPIFDNSTKYSWEKLYEFLQGNLTYPESAKADKVEGQVFVQFWIDTNGFTSEHKIIQSVRQDLDDEALRVAKLIKFDVPAKNYCDEPIGMCWQMPIRFTLNEGKPTRNTIKESNKNVRKKNSKGGGSSEVIDNKKRNNGL
ncbi:MAG: energy transducer TonB [Bacteroidales bacterium]|jgi:TonB family protein|nr:energy transducer TonB [Bacteroidales bacterium]